MLRGVIVAALLVATASTAYPVESDPVVWDNSSSGEGTRQLNSPYLGECVCDVTRGMCDPNCCCDPDCGEAAINVFGGCEPEQYGYPDIQYCYEENRATQIKRINNINDVYLDKQRQGYAAVCIVRTNHPGSLYRYFSFPTTTQRPAPPLSNTIQTIASVALTVGDPLPVAKYVDVGGELVFRGIGNFQLPLQRKNGQCSDFERDIGFLNPLQGVSCALSGEQICGLFPVERLVNLFVYLPVANQSDLAMVPVNVNVYNSSSGELMGTINASDTAYAGAFNSVNDGVLCNNAVTRFSAEFVYSITNETALANASINVTVAHVPLATFVAMSFQAAFVREGETLPQSIIPATPGYMAGGAVRGGTLISSTTGNESIVERRGGFAIPSGGRSCELQNFRTVGFMHSVTSSGCLVTVSETELQSICSSGNAALVLGAINATYADGSPSAMDYVARTNDALTNDTSSWVPIQGIHSVQFAAGNFDAFARRCSGMVVGLSYQFVIARAGAEFNPQDLVVGAFVEPIIGSWRIRNATDFTGSATAKQRLLFRVSFSRYDPDSQATIRRRVKAPPILPRLDDSIFYPFRRPYPR